MAARGPFVLGLVGRTGSGKTTVAEALAADGAEVISGDAVGHEVTDRDLAVREALSLEYGADVYRADGTLDRKRVAARVFGDAAARERLDRLVHPRIIERIESWLDALEARGFRGTAVIDAALLLEWGLERRCDAVLAVVAPEEAHLARLTRGRGWSAIEAGRRLEAQRSPAAFAAAADATLDNRGTLDELRRAARDTVARLRERHAAPPGTGKDPC